MKKLLAIVLSWGLLAGAAAAQGLPNFGGMGVPNATQSYNYPFSASTVGATGDSRMADVFVSTCNGVPIQCGTSGTNFLVQAIAQGGNKLQIGTVTAISGCRTDQYLWPTNFARNLASSDQWMLFGYPMVNNLGAAGNGCTINPSGGSGFPFTYTNFYGQVISVDLSNVALLAANDIMNAADQAIYAGKKVIISLEPGQAPTDNTAVTVGQGNAQIASGVLTVNSLSSGRYAVNQILSGAGITANSVVIVGSGVTNSSACTPACTGVGAAGTYAINNTALSIAAETISGQYSKLAALFEGNGYLTAYVASKPGQAFLYDPRPALWSATGSATAINFKAGMMLDGNGTTTGTHYGWLGGFTGGAALNTQVPALTMNIPDIGASSINNIFPGNVRQLINNALFNGTQTGGTLSTCVTAGGNATPPTGWQVACGSASTTVNMSVAADTNGYGNAFTVTFTSAGADSVSIRNLSPAAGLVALGSFYQGSAVVSVAAGSSNCTVFGENQINSTTPPQTRSSYALYGGSVASGGGSNVGPTTAYTIPLRTPPASYISSTTATGFLSWRIDVVFPAAGNCTVTVSRPSLERVFVYNPVTGTFSGWLLMRDLDPAANDNSPAWLLKAG